MWRTSVMAKWRIVFPVAMELDLDRHYFMIPEITRRGLFVRRQHQYLSRLYPQNKQAIQLLASGLNKIFTNEACERSVNTTRTTPSIAFSHFKTT